MAERPVRLIQKRSEMKPSQSSIQGAQDKASFYTVDNIAQYLSYHQERMQRVRASSYYLYTRKPTEEYMNDENPYIDMGDINLFYYPAIKAARIFTAAEDALWLTGTRMFDNKPQTDDYARSSETILNEGNNLVQSFIKMHNTPATPPPAVSQLNGFDQLQMRRYYQRIGAEKPEEFRETMRRHIPRWMTHPLSLSLESADEEEKRQSNAVINGYKMRDAHYLTSPDALAEGKLPLHLALRTAAIAEVNGHNHLGYKLRTQSITDILSLEQERAQGEHAELPFFTYAFAGLMTGEARPNRQDTVFDYESAINDTIRLTFQRVQAKEADAVAFLRQLAQVYPDHISELVARSIITQGRVTGAFDEVAVLRTLGETGEGWANESITQALSLPNRRVLLASEIPSMPFPLTTSFTPQEVVRDRETLLKNDDAYSFKLTDQKAQGNRASKKASLSIDLQKMAPAIDASFQSAENGTARYLPLRVGYADGEVGIDIVSGEVDEETKEHYRDVIATALRQEAEKRRSEETEAKLEIDLLGEARAQNEGNGRSRLERMTRYQEAKAKGKKKTKGMPSPSLLQTSSLPEQDNGEDDSDQEEKRERKVLGLDIPTIATLLAAERIEVVTAEQVFKRLTQSVSLANTNQRILGKKLTNDALSNDKDVQKMRTQVRQLNWRLDGRHIRIYLEDMGQGTFALQGILHKKDAEQQTRYLNHMFTRLIRDKKAREKEEQEKKNT